MNERDKTILGKIRVYALQVLEFKDDLGFDEFSDDAKTISACVFNLSQIGELAGRLSAEFVEENNEIPWRKIRGMRNKIVHDYEGVKLNIVWDVLNEFLPEMIENIDKII